MFLALQSRLSGRPAGSIAPAAPAGSRAVAGCSITAPSAGGGDAAAAAYDADVMSVVERFMAAASTLGDDVAKPSNIVRDAFTGEVLENWFKVPQATKLEVYDDLDAEDVLVIARPRLTMASGAMKQLRPRPAGQRRIVAAIAACTKPDAAGLQQLVGPVGEQMQKVHNT